MTWRNRNLYLIGLPGAGKSAIGHSLAALLDRYAFIDLDAEIEHKTGRTIAEIFSQDGEEAFRTIESAELLRFASIQGKPRIVATGGGIVLNSINRAIMRGSGIPIWIDVTVREAVRNLRNDILQGHSRPLFQDTTEDGLKRTLTDVLGRRRQWYEQAVLHFVSRSTPGNEHTPAELASELLTALNQMSLSVALKPRHNTLIAKSALGNYPIFVGNATAIRELGHYVSENDYSQIILITDENVEQLHGKEFLKEFNKSAGAKVAFRQIIIPSGEIHKNLESLQHILRQFHKWKASRRSTLVVAFGGGVVTDIAGFAASLYHRGLPLVHIPTSLIAQADAAIGGKTGIDYLGSKNEIGTFYPPKLVLVDPLYLRTLPERELLAGLAEVYKYALIGNRDLWEQLSKQLHRLTRGMNAAYEAVIFDSIQEKIRYVEADEFERVVGVRELLNFGHTFGHALEAATNFESFLHGEAVLLGMRAAAWLSKELGHLSVEDWSKIEAVLAQIPITSAIETNTERVFSSFQRDKKGTGRVVLLRSIGEAFVTEISEQDARRAIDTMLTFA
jgi:shikimate kinase / 3-dehydroquinate synthase